MYTPPTYAALTPMEITRRMSPPLQHVLVELQSGRHPYLSTGDHEQLRTRGLLTTTCRVTPLGWAVATCIKEKQA